MNKRCLLGLVLISLMFPWAGCKKAGEAAKPAPLPTGAAELKLQWPKGRRVVESYSMAMSGTINLPGQAPQKQDVEMRLKFQNSAVKDTATGGRLVEMEFLGSALSLAMNGQKLVDFDSAKNGPGDNKNGSWKAMIGRKLQYYLDASNRVENVEGIKELRSSLSADGTQAASAANQMLDSIYSRETFKQLLDNGTYLPGKPVAPGDSWPVEVNTTSGQLGEVTDELTFTLGGWEVHDGHNCAHLTFDGTMATHPDSQTDKSKMKASINSSKLTGDTWFDLDRGLFLEGAAHVDLDMKIVMPNPAAALSPKQPKELNLTYTTHIEQGTKVESVD